ncbi:hypothetical protein [Streptomyces thermoalcalitolerans]|uniref:Secreted protein n=1 Tax=Streptomyces thermoalcalitolerans TaxID=65605 RepID=A0ABN1PAI3_9ACTN
MRNRLLRSVLVAAFSVVAALGALSGLSGAESEARANTYWPAVGANSDVVGGVSGTTGGAGS